MFKIMGAKPEEVLSGYLVPFRSPSWGALSEKPNSIKFGMDVWCGIFRRAKAKTVIAFGKQLAPYMKDLLKAELRGKRKAGWGDQTIDAYRFGTDGDGRLSVLPHLSRFALFNRVNAQKSENAFRVSLGMSPP